MAVVIELLELVVRLCFFRLGNLSQPRRLPLARDPWLPTWHMHLVPAFSEPATQRSTLVMSEPQLPTFDAVLKLLGEIEERIQLLKLPESKISGLCHAMNQLCECVEDHRKTAESCRYLSDTDPVSGIARAESLLQLGDLKQCDVLYYSVVIGRTSLQRCSDLEGISSALAALSPPRGFKMWISRQSGRPQDLMVLHNIPSTYLQYSEGKYSATKLPHSYVVARVHKFATSQDHARIWPRCHGLDEASSPVTGEQVLDELDAWVVGPGRFNWESKQVLYLTGGAYTGKSTIASEMCRRLSARGLLGASFFCGNTESPQQVLSLIRDKFFLYVAAQLAESQPALYNAIFSAVADAQWLDSPSYMALPLAESMTRACVELVQGPLRTLPGKHPPIYIIIDALDGGDFGHGSESSSWQIALSKLLSLLLSCVQESPRHLRILLTSRSGARYISQAIDCSCSSPYVHHISLHTRSRTISRHSTICTLLRRAIDEQGWTRSEIGTQHASLITGLADEARGWILYAQATSSAVLHDLAVLKKQLHEHLIERRDLHTSAILYIDESPGLDNLSHFLWTNYMSPILIPALNPPEFEITLLSSILCYVPDDPSDVHQVTTRMLGLITAVPSPIVGLALHQFRSVIVSEENHADSPLYFLHPICRTFISEHSSIETARLPTSAAVVESLVRIGCVRAILSCMDAADGEIPLSSAEFARYAQEHRPPTAPDIGDLAFAFTYLREHPIEDSDLGERDGHAPEAAAVAKRFLALDDAMLDEFYLWICVAPR
ncbi:hypothetical protein C8Q80DRAFT_176784 [Daedaleopsis nitida]|nr:hypothetical protein C8Q80DRAFT_176784 [Daedaleopsis nitida]